MDFHKVDHLTDRDSVLRFFEWLYSAKSLIFHPDDSFAGYVNHDTKKPTFTNSQARHLDSLMADAFAICDPYIAGFEVQHRLGMISDSEWQELRQ